MPWLAAIPRPVRYVVVGGVGFVVNLLVFLALADGLGLDVRWAEVVSRVLGGVVTFFGHKHVTFSGDQALPASLQGASYLALAAVNVALAPWVVFGCVAAFGGLVWPKLVAEVLLTVESYLLTRLIFRAR